MANNAAERLLSSDQGSSISHEANSQLINVSKCTSPDEDDDIRPMLSVREFYKEFCIESKKLWFLAAPSIFTSICQYSIGAITQIFAGQLGTIQLAAVSVENSVIAAFSYGIMMGMGSALETLCGQAYGANQFDMLGIYMQRSWVILNTVALAMVPIFIFATPILRLLGQTEDISTKAGSFAVLMIPQQFAYAMMFPSTKFLQSQSKVMAMAVIAAAALCLHSFFSWLFMMKLGWGLVGAAVVLDSSWLFIGIAQLLYVLSGTCNRAWSGFSWKAFHDLWGFVRLSVASAVMLCLEIWYVMALVLFAGYLQNAEVSVAAFSVCINILGWASMVAFGFNVAISVRVSNELGLGHPRTAKFSVIVVGLVTLLLGLFFSFSLIITRKQYPALFTSSNEVMQLVDELTPLLGVSIIFTNLQYALSGVAIGAGWQAFVAYINIGCYFLFGVPLGILMGYYLDMGVKGLWYGLVAGLCLQTCLLLWTVLATNWNKEADIVEDRLKQWGGSTDYVTGNDLKG